MDSSKKDISNAINFFRDDIDRIINESLQESDGVGFISMNNFFRKGPSATGLWGTFAGVSGDKAVVNHAGSLYESVFSKDFPDCLKDCYPNVKHTIPTKYEGREMHMLSGAVHQEEGRGIYFCLKDISYEDFKERVIPTPRIVKAWRIASKGLKGILKPRVKALKP